MILENGMLDVSEIELETLEGGDLGSALAAPAQTITTIAFLAHGAKEGVYRATLENFASPSKWFKFASPAKIPAPAMELARL